MSEVVWEGWKLTTVKHAGGGAHARTQKRQRQKRNGQEHVLSLIKSVAPDAAIGESDLTIERSTVNNWLENLTADKTLSIYEVRDRVNFLALGLERGKRMLNWNVVVPAPMHIIHPERGAFTGASLETLNQHRIDSTRIQTALSGCGPHYLNNKGSISDKDKELQSWGTFLYLAVTVDGVCSMKHLCDIASNTRNIWVTDKLSWITLYEESGDEADEIQITKKDKKPTPWRYLLGPASLDRLLYHIAKYGHPECSEGQEAKVFATNAWRAFCKSKKLSGLSLEKIVRQTSSLLDLYLPAYLISDHSSTCLPSKRLVHLLHGGKAKKGYYKKKQRTSATLSLQRLSISTFSSEDKVLEKSANQLKVLKSIFCKRDGEDRKSFAEISELLSELRFKDNIAPVVQALVLWATHLHESHRTQRTIYTYLTKIASPLFLELSIADLSESNRAVIDRAYSKVIDSSLSPTIRKYRSELIILFHKYLVENLGLSMCSIELPNIKSGRNVDASFITEKEFKLIASSIREQINQPYGEIAYWMTVLGYRAGLRISEAQHIQIRDIQILDDSSSIEEASLFIRPNKKNDTKSNNSQRQLPLHLLLTEAELTEFIAFVRRRKHATHSRVMLFSEGIDTAAPVELSEIYSIIHQAMRYVTGDPNAHFHQLRHSLANVLLFTYHEITPPWCIATHLRPLFVQLGPIKTRKGLFFISQIMGHACPSTTIQKYMHCIEFIKQHYVRNTYLANEVLNNTYTLDRELIHFQEMLEMRPATIRKWKERYGENIEC